MLPELTRKRLIVVLGKGGVGRSTVAAAIGLYLARRGKNTLLYQANAKDKLHLLLGGPVVGEQIVPMGERIWAVNPSPASALHEYGLMVLRYETIYKMVFENRLSKALVRAIPGVDDYALLGKLWWHTTEMAGTRPRWDSIVFDAPATGHAVTMFRIPRAILDAVPEGPLTRDAAKVQSLLQDPARTAPLIVTLAEEMPTNESIELAQRLRRDAGMEPAAVIVNQLFPDHFKRGSTPARVLEALAAGEGKNDPTLSPLLERALTSQARRELNDRYLARLAAELPLPTARLPTLFTPTLGPAEVQRLSLLLEEQIESVGGAVTRA